MPIKEFVQSVRSRVRSLSPRRRRPVDHPRPPPPEPLARPTAPPAQAAGSALYQTVARMAPLSNAELAFGEQSLDQLAKAETFARTHLRNKALADRARELILSWENDIAQEEDYARAQDAVHEFWTEKAELLANVWSSGSCDEFDWRWKRTKSRVNQLMRAIELAFSRLKGQDVALWGPIHTEWNASMRRMHALAGEDVPVNWTSPSAREFLRRWLAMEFECECFEALMPKAPHPPPGVSQEEWIHALAQLKDAQVHIHAKGNLKLDRALEQLIRQMETADEAEWTELVDRKTKVLASAWSQFPELGDSHAEFARVLKLAQEDLHEIPANAQRSLGPTFAHSLRQVQRECAALERQARNPTRANLYLILLTRYRIQLLLQKAEELSLVKAKHSREYGSPGLSLRAMRRYTDLPSI